MMYRYIMPVFSKVFQSLPLNVMYCYMVPVLSKVYQSLPLHDVVPIHMVPMLEITYMSHSNFIKLT